ncbi:MAG: metallophosphoesterase [Cytophagales bacterium]
MLRIAQITDIHLSDDRSLSYGVDTWANFEWAVSSVWKSSPDLLVISGDICLSDGILETYHEVKKRLDASNIPYQIIPGNHDSPEMMAHV